MEKSKRGGARAGAGRPPKAGKGSDPRKMVSVRLPAWLVVWLGQQKDQTATIEKALIDFYGLRAPKREDPDSITPF
jgi:hypothetical protein